MAERTGRSQDRSNLPEEAAEAGVGEVRGFPQRWVVALLMVAATAGIVPAVAGNFSGAVFETLGLGALLTPVLVAAWMLGLLLTKPFAARGCFAGSPWPAGWRSLVAVALGLGALALATLGLGTIHLIEPGGRVWPVLVLLGVAIVAGVPATREFLGRTREAFLSMRVHRGGWLLLIAAVPIGVMLVAATFPPGKLWHTEGNGYDVLEYHLQLPREYALNNATAPVAHNVYSFFPANIEMLYLLVMQFAKGIMGNDRIIGYLWATYPSQILHALLMVLTAAALALMPLGKAGDKPWLHATGRAIAAVFFMGTPWTIITGSLAYNEGGMLFFGTLALGFALELAAAPRVPADGNAGAWSRRLRADGILIGVLLGLAVGCKLTAGLFFAVPLALLLGYRALTNSAYLRLLAGVTVTACIVYAPWAIRAAVYSGGNPVFPIATSVLPRDGWTAAQGERFDRGHRAPEGQQKIGQRLKALADNSVYVPEWSVQPYVLLNITASPQPSLESFWDWKRGNLLLLIVPVTIIGAFITRAGRGETAFPLAVLAVQVGAWLFATHLQSRFLLPAAVPMALLAGRGVQGLHVAAEGIFVAAFRIAAGTLVVLHALCTIFLLLPEARLLGGVVALDNKPGPAPPIGEWICENVAAEVRAHAGTLPAGGVAPEPVLLLGAGTPWLFAEPVDYFTVFDTNPVLEALTANDPARVSAWLAQHKIHYVWVDWFELARLQDSYGLGLDIPAKEQGATLAARSSDVAKVYGPRLLAAGLQDTQTNQHPGYTVYAVPEK